MLDIFVNMNLEMQKTGNLSASISKEELLKLVCRCIVINQMLTDGQTVGQHQQGCRLTSHMPPVFISGVHTRFIDWSSMASCGLPLTQVAQNNLILTDIITKLGLLDYYDVAWKTSQCAVSRTMGAAAASDQSATVSKLAK